MKYEMIRPVRCWFCGEPLYYAGDERHTPEIHVSTDDDSFHAHRLCWDNRMVPDPAPFAGGNFPACSCHFNQTNADCPWHGDPRLRCQAAKGTDPLAERGGK